MGYQAPARSFAVRLDVEDESLRQSLAAAIAGHPELVLANVMPHGTGVVVTDHADGAETDAPTLAIGRRGATAEIAASLLFEDDLDLVPAAAALVAAGYLVVPAAEQAGFDAEPPMTRFIQPLTPRERDVLTLLVAGASNKLIARNLGISVHTAKFHVTAVTDKLKARNRSEAVGIALRNGLVPL